MALVKPGEKNFFQRNKRRLPPIENIGIKIRVLGISLLNDLEVGKVIVSALFKFDVNLIFLFTEHRLYLFFRNLRMSHLLHFRRNFYLSSPLTNLMPFRNEKNYGKLLSLFFWQKFRESIVFSKEITK